MYKDMIFLLFLIQKALCYQTIGPFDNYLTKMYFGVNYSLALTFIVVILEHLQPISSGLAIKCNYNNRTIRNGLLHFHVTHSKCSSKLAWKPFQCEPFDFLLHLMRWNWLGVWILKWWMAKVGFENQWSWNNDSANIIQASKHGQKGDFIPGPSRTGSWGTVKLRMGWNNDLSCQADGIQLQV